MDALGWIVAIVVILLLGKNVNLSALLPLGQQNAVPIAADNLPVISAQDNTNSPACQPSTWASPCNPSGQAQVMSIASSAAPIVSIPVRGTALTTQPINAGASSTVRPAANAPRLTLQSTARVISGKYTY
jgi:hypothetical protein